MARSPHHWPLCSIDLTSRRYSDSTTCIVSLYDHLLRPCKVIRHRLGSSLASAVELMHESDPSVYVDVSCTKDGKIMLISKNSKSSSEVWYAPSSDPSAPFKCIRPRRQGLRYYVEHCDGWLYVMHNDGCSNFRVARLPASCSSHCAQWEDFIAGDVEGAVLEDMDM